MSNCKTEEKSEKEEYRRLMKIDFYILSDSRDDISCRSSFIVSYKDIVLYHRNRRICMQSCTESSCTHERLEWSKLMVK